jgi:hypothetical protein
VFVLRLPTSPHDVLRSTLCKGFEVETPLRVHRSASAHARTCHHAAGHPAPTALSGLLLNNSASTPCTLHSTHTPQGALAHNPEPEPNRL